MTFDRHRCISDLQNFYKEHELEKDKFNCKWKATCVSSAAPRPLVHGMEAHIGSKYGEALRIVVVSLDSGGDSSKMDDRRLEIEGTDESRLNSHMQGTVGLLKAILEPQIGKNASPLPYYSMLNSAKCAGGDGSSDKLKDSIHRRCMPYLFDEFEALKPQLIWLQGMTISYLLRGHLQPIAESAAVPLRKLASSSAEMISELFAQIKVSGKLVPVIKTYHPSSRRGEWAEFTRTLLPQTAAAALEIGQSSR